MSEINKYSKTVTQDPTPPAAQAMLHAVGLTDEDFKKAQVGIASTGWDGNPYAYAGNNPLNTTDPTGLRPLTDDELKAYDGSSRGAFATAGNWINENREYIAGGLAIVVGAALMFVPGGQIAGMGLMSFGADVVIQKATTGKVNWAQSAAIGVTGAVGGAGFAAARITMAASSSASRIGGYVAINAGVNGAAGAVANGGVPYSSIATEDSS